MQFEEMLLPLKGQLRNAIVNIENPHLIVLYSWYCLLQYVLFAMTIHIMLANMLLHRIYC